MTRVSENSTSHAVRFAVAKAKSKLEDLQIKGSNLKRIQKPSDDPVGNVQLLQVRSKLSDANQYERNAAFAKMHINVTEGALEELSELLSKAKEIAVGQASDLYNKDIRQSIAREINQLRNQAIGIGNRRFANRYLFSGHKTLTRPFSKDGEYFGDDGKINLEIDKDFFVPINFTGNEIFFSTGNKKIKEVRPLENTPFEQLDGLEKRTDPATNNRKDFPDDFVKEEQKRDIASEANNNPNKKTPKEDRVPKDGILSDLQSLENALVTNNTIIIQSMLERLDRNINNIIQTRSELGSIYNTIENAENTIEATKLHYDGYKSQIEDADVAELYSELTKQENVMAATYKASNSLINKSLLDFLR